MSLKANTRFLLRLDQKLYLKLTRMASAKKESINSLCNQLLAASVEIGTTGNDLLVRKIKEVYQDEKLLGIVFFGSRARGEETQSSDFDLLLVFDSTTSINRSLYRKWEDELHSIHCVTMPKTEDDTSNFWFEIALDGIILWENRDELKKKFSLLKLKLSSGRYQRRLTHGQPYWIKKEI